MKFSALSLVVSLVTLSIAPSAYAIETAPTTPAPAPIAQPGGARFRFGVELNGGAALVAVFSNRSVLVGASSALTFRLGAQVNDHFALMVQSSASVRGNLVSMPTSLLAEYNPSRNFGLAVGPTLATFMLSNGPLFAPGGTLRAQGYLGSTATSRWHSFAFGVESTTAVMPNGIYTSLGLTVGYEMH